MEENLIVTTEEVYVLQMIAVNTILVNFVGVII